MSKQYLRYLKVTFAGRTIVYDGAILDDLADGKGQGPGLRVRFRTQQKDASTPNVLWLDIFNTADNTDQAALKMVGAQISLYAGYTDGPHSLLFSGQIKQARAKVRDSVEDPDSHLAILATDSGLARNNAVVNKSLAAGHTHMDRAMIAANALKGFGVQIGYIDKDALSKIKFPRGFACFGMAKDLLRQTCFATATSWSIQNGSLQIVSANKPKPGSTVVLTGRTGLIGQARQTIGGIEATALLNGQIIPTTTVKIDNRSIQQAEQDPSIAGAPNNNLLAQYGAFSSDGTYKVFYVGHVGDTRGEEWYTNFVAVSTHVGIVPPQYAARGITLPN